MAKLGTNLRPTSPSVRTAPRTRRAAAPPPDARESEAPRWFAGSPKRWLAILASYVAIAAVCTYPLIRAPASTIEWGGGDSLLVTYILSWDVYALTHAVSVFDASFYYPTANTLSFSEHLLSVAWLLAPLQLGLRNPILFYNLTVLASAFLSAWLMWAYLRFVGCGSLASWLGGLLFGFMPWRLGQIGHAQLEYTWWIPGALLLFEMWLSRKSPWSAWGVGVLLGLVFEACVYHGYFFLLFFSFYSAIRLATDTRRLPPARTAFGHLALCGLGMVLIVGASAAGYRRAAKVVPSATESATLEVRGADLGDYFNPPGLSLLTGSLARDAHPYSDIPWEMHAFPGWVALTSLLVGVFAVLRGRRPRDELASLRFAWVGAAVCLFAVSLGPVVHGGGATIVRSYPYLFLYRFLPGFSAMRVPVRASFFVGFAGAALASVWMTPLLASPPSAGRRRILGAGLIGVCLLDVLPRPLPYARPEEYVRLRAAFAAGERPASGTDLVLPICDEINGSAPAASFPAFRHLVNGRTGYLPRQNGAAFRALGKRPFRAGQGRLVRALEVTRILVDRSRMSAAYEREILAGLADAGARVARSGSAEQYDVVSLDWSPTGSSVTAPGR